MFTEITEDGVRFADGTGHGPSASTLGATRAGRAAACAAVRRLDREERAAG